MLLLVVRANLGAMRDRDEDRVSLTGLDPETALRALLRVDPESEPVEESKRSRASEQDDLPRKREQR